MIQKELDLSHTCKFVSTSWENNTYPTDVSLEYIEHAADHYSRNNEESLDISKEKAIEIIIFLKSAFDINP